MEQVRVIARAVALEGRSEELKTLLRGMVAPTRNEAGCIYYELFESNIPGLFYFNELWESQQHLDAHAASKHFTEIFGKAKALMQGPPEVNLLKEVV
jgi:quinol monooxygenase YgiN